MRAALDAGLNDMWQTLMEDPELGVLFPVNHMSEQIEKGLFRLYPELASEYWLMKATV